MSPIGGVWGAEPPTVASEASEARLVQIQTPYFLPTALADPALDAGFGVCILRLRRRRNVAHRGVWGAEPPTVASAVSEARLVQNQTPYICKQAGGGPGGGVPLLDTTQPIARRSER